MPQYEYSYQTFRSDDVGAQLTIWGQEGWRVVDFKTEGAWNWMLLERPYQERYIEDSAKLFDGHFETGPGTPISAPVESK